MRWLALILCFVPRLASASDWGLEAGLVGGVGAADFAGGPTGFVAPTHSTNFFAAIPPTSVAPTTSLAGDAGASFNFTYKRKLYLDLELSASGQSLRLDDKYEYPSTTIRHSTVWEWSSFRPLALISYAHPIKMGEGWALAPRLGGGLWYETVIARRKRSGIDGGTPSEAVWQGAPPEDWGWVASVGVDWLMLGKGAGPKRIGLECRWREGRAAPEAAVGADKPVRVIEGVLTVPLALWVI